MKITNVETIQSATIVGASFTLLRLTDAMRSRIKLDNAAYFGRIDDLQEEAREIYDLKKKDPDTVTPELKQKLREIENEIISISNEHVDGAYFRTCVKDIALEVDDVKVTPENVREVAPAAFFDELVTKVRRFSVLGYSETKN